MVIIKQQHMGDLNIERIGNHHQGSNIKEAICIFWGGGYTGIGYRVDGRIMNNECMQLVVL